LGSFSTVVVVVVVFGVGVGLVVVVVFGVGVGLVVVVVFGVGVGLDVVVVFGVGVGLVVVVVFGVGVGFVVVVVFGVGVGLVVVVVVGVVVVVVVVGSGQISTNSFPFFTANAFVLQPLISGSQTHFASSDSRGFLLFIPSRNLAHVEQGTLSKESQALPPESTSLSSPIDAAAV